MLEKLHIQNYKCLRDVTVDLGPFTILIGANDSGKSSFLEAIRLSHQLTGSQISSVFAGHKSLGNILWRKDTSLTLDLEMSGRVESMNFTYHLAVPASPRPPVESLHVDGKPWFWFSAQGKVLVQDNIAQTILTHTRIPIADLTTLASFARVNVQPVKALADSLASTEEYHFELQNLRSSAVPEVNPTLHASGENLPSVLDALRNDPDRSAFDGLEKALHDAIPTVAGVVCPVVANLHGQPQGHKGTAFILAGNGKPPVTIPAALASGGALLVTAFLALAYGNTPGLLLIEEPENGLHPFLLKMVIEVLRKISTGEVGNRPRQVIVTTHSPLLLNYARPEEVRVFVRDVEEGTRVTALSEVAEIGKLLEEFGLGELWYMLGEKKMLEGQPA